MKENQKNQLFLFKLSENGIKKAEIIMDWFENIQVIFPNSKLRMLEIRAQKNKNFAEFLGTELNRYDTGVNRISSVYNEVNFKEILKNIEVPEDVIEEISNTKSGMVEIQGKIFAFSEGKDEQIFYELKLEHTLNNKIFGFNKDEESDGTQRLLDLLPILYSINTKSKVYFIDELDRSLHTRLSKDFINSFAEKSNGTNNQLIFTAHDTNLMNLDDMRQDEIWFVDKNNLGETYIKPFSDFTITKDYDTIKAYIAGRFGAVPQIKTDSEVES